MEWIGADFGLSGHTCRVRGRRGDGEVVDVAIKLSPADKSATEMAFYRWCAPSTPIQLPRFLGGNARAGRGYILFDYLDDVRQGDVLVGVDRDGVVALASSLAHLHTRWWNATAPELAHIVARTRPQRSAAPTIDPNNLARFFQRHGDTLTPSQADMIRGLPSRLPEIHNLLWRGERTLLHTDFHLDNVLWAPDGSPVVLDWEGAMVGPPEVDLARILIECLRPDQVEELAGVATAIYTDHLAADGIERGRIDERRLEAAAARSLAGIVGWLGAEKRPPADSRARRLGANGMAATLGVIAYLR